MSDIPLMPGRSEELDGTYKKTVKPGTMNPAMLWTPATNEVLNMVSSIDTYYETHSLSRAGMVVHTSRAMYRLSQRMDLQAYPFDEHVLVFALTSSVYNSSFVVLSLLEDEAAWDQMPWQRDIL